MTRASCTKTMSQGVIHANNVVTVPNIWGWVKFDGSTNVAHVHCTRKQTSSSSSHTTRRKKAPELLLSKFSKFREFGWVRPRRDGSIIIYYNHIFGGIRRIFGVCLLVYVCQSNASFMIFSLCSRAVFALCHGPKINFNDANFRTFIRKSGRNWNKYHVSMTALLSFPPISL